MLKLYRFLNKCCFNPKCPIELFTPPILLKLTGNTPNGLTYHCVE